MRIRALHSSKIPNDQSNPYLYLLGFSLEANRVSIYWFSWRTALFRRWDVFHMHWPENLVASRYKVLIPFKVFLMHLLILRLKIEKIPVVYTVHNEEPHEALSGFARKSVNLALSRVNAVILMTPVRLNPAINNSVPVYRIPHGTFRTIFPAVVERKNQRKRVLAAGLIRPYKRVPELVTAFRSLNKPGYQLRVVGRPSSTDVRDELVELASKDSRVSLRLEFVADQALFEELSDADLLVLNYSGFANSGMAILALSLGVPVLVPRSQASIELHDEIGEAWVHLFDDPIEDSYIEQALAFSPDNLGGSNPDMPSRDWGRIGKKITEIYSEVLK